jgi:hypothetical protein
MKNPTKVTRRILQHCVIATLPFYLTSCMGIYENSFECPPGKGIGCSSISEVNVMVDQGKLQSDDITPMSTQDTSVIWFNPWADTNHGACAQDQNCKTDLIGVNGSI